MELLSFDAWWEGQMVFSKIYWLITIPATIIFLFQLALTFRNSDSKNESLKTDNDETKIAYQPISFRNLIGFFAIFGWSGLACIDSGLSVESTILTSFLCGLIMMFTMATVFYFMSKLMKSVREGLE